MGGAENGPPQTVVVSSVLGRDGSDSDYSWNHVAAAAPARQHLLPDQPKPHWWKRVSTVLWSPKQQQQQQQQQGVVVPPSPINMTPNEQQNNDDHYTRFQDNNDEHKKKKKRHKKTLSWSDVVVVTTTQEEAPKKPPLLLPSVVPKEDAVAKDCPFFYQQGDDAYYDALQECGSQQQQQQQNDGDSLLPFGHRAAYHARYQQLNRVDVVPNDLQLEEDDVSRQQREDWLLASSSVAGFSRSSFYYNHDGHALMKLPRDKVRLLMDPDLEPGILSVLDSQEPTYVLTVDEDLYRRVVKEISVHHTYPLNCYRCCTADGHADIRVAWCILVFIFIFLLVNTIIWPID